MSRTIADRRRGRAERDGSSPSPPHDGRHRHPPTDDCECGLLPILANSSGSTVSNSHTARLLHSSLYSSSAPIVRRPVQYPAAASDGRPQTHLSQQRAARWQVASGPEGTGAPRRASFLSTPMHVINSSDAGYPMNDSQANSSGSGTSGARLRSLRNGSDVAGSFLSRSSLMDGHGDSAPGSTAPRRGVRLPVLGSSDSPTNAKGSLGSSPNPAPGSTTHRARSVVMPRSGGGSGVYSWRGGGGSRNLSMHSLVVRQKNDDNFDYGLDALGIPAESLRGPASRSLIGAGQSATTSSLGGYSVPSANRSASSPLNIDRSAASTPSPLETLRRTAAASVPLMTSASPEGRVAALGDGSPLDSSRRGGRRASSARPGPLPIASDELPVTSPRKAGRGPTAGTGALLHRSTTLAARRLSGNLGDWSSIVYGSQAALGRSGSASAGRSGTPPPSSPPTMFSIFGIDRDAGSGPATGPEYSYRLLFGIGSDEDDDDEDEDDEDSVVDDSESSSSPGSNATPSAIHGSSGGLPPRQQSSPLVPPSKANATRASAVGGSGPGSSSVTSPGPGGAMTGTGSDTLCNVSAFFPLAPLGAAVSTEGAAGWASALWRTADYPLSATPGYGSHAIISPFDSRQHSTSLEGHRSPGNLSAYWHYTSGNERGSLVPGDSARAASEQALAGGALVASHADSSAAPACRDGTGRLLRGVTLWSRPAGPLAPTPPPPPPATAAAAAARLPLGVSDWVQPRGLVLLEMAATGAEPAAPAVTMLGHQVAVHLGHLQGTCAADECVRRTRGSVELPSTLLADSQSRFAAHGENVFVLLMDRLGVQPPAAPTARWPAAAAAPRRGLLPVVARDVLKAVLAQQAAAGKSPAARLDLRVSIAYLIPGSARPPADPRAPGVPPAAAAPTYMDLIDAGDATPGAARLPVARLIEAASSPIFGRCINGCQWLLVESAAELEATLDAAATKVKGGAGAAHNTSMAGALTEGVLWMQFLLVRRTVADADVLVSSYTVASTANASLFENVLDQRPSSPWGLFRHALGKAPCHVIVVAALTDGDAEAAHPLAVLQRVMQTPHPQAQRGSIAAYVRSLRARQRELEKARLQLPAVNGRDARRFTIRLGLIAANLEDFRAFLADPDSVAVPVYIDAVGDKHSIHRGGGGGEAALHPREQVAITAGAPQLPNSAGVASSTTHRLDPAAPATVALLSAGGPPSAFKVVPAADGSSCTLHLAAPQESASYTLTECVRLMSAASVLRTVAALGTLEDEFRNGFNTNGIFLRAGESSASSSFPVVADMATGLVRGVFAAVAAAAASPPAPSTRRAATLKERGLIFRLSASIYAIHGGAVIDLFALGDGDAAPPPFALTLARSLLLGLSASGVQQRNVTSETAFGELLATGRRRLQRVSAAWAGAASDPHAHVLSLQLKQQDPVTRDVAVSNISLFSLDQQFSLLADALAKASVLEHRTAPHPYKRRQATTSTATMSVSVGGQGSDCTQLHTLLSETLRGAGHCACAVVLDEPPAAVSGPEAAAHRSRVSAALAALTAVTARRTESQRVPQGSVARLVLRLRKLRAKLARARDFHLVRQNVARLDKIMFDAEQLLYHPRENDVKYYARSTAVGLDPSTPLGAHGPQPQQPAPSAHRASGDGSTTVTLEPDREQDAYREGSVGLPFSLLGARPPSGPRAATQPARPATIAPPPGSARSPRTSSASTSSVVGGSGAATTAATATTTAAATGASAPYYYGLRYDRDPVLLMPDDAAKGPRDRPLTQLHVPTLIVVGAAAAGEAAREGTYVACVVGQSRVEVVPAGSAGASPGGRRASAHCEADEVAEIRAASSSLKSTTLARLLSCVVSGRTAAMLSMDTAPAVASTSVSCLMVCTAVNALFASLAETGNPFIISMRAFSFRPGYTRAVDLLRHLTDEHPGELLATARQYTRSAAADAPETAPLLSRVRYSPMCGPTFGSATTVPVQNTQHFEALLITALAFAAAFDSAADGGGATGPTPGGCAVALQLTIHQFVTARNDVMLSSLWAVNASSGVLLEGQRGAATGSASAVSQHILPYLLGGPCYTTAILGLSEAPTPSGLSTHGSALQSLRAVGLHRPRLGSVAAYETFLENALARARERPPPPTAAATSLATSSSTTSLVSASTGDQSRLSRVTDVGSISRTDDSSSPSGSAPRLAALLHEARVLRQKGLEALRTTGKVPGLLAHQANFFHSLDEFDAR